MTLRSITLWILIGCGLVLLGWDIYLSAVREATISNLIWAWSATHPIIPFVGGLLCGHLWWRR